MLPIALQWQLYISEPLLQTLISLQKNTFCSNYSLADLRHSSCHYFHYNRNFTPCFLEHLPKDGLAWWSFPSYQTIRLLPQQLNREILLATTLQSKFWMTAYSLNIADTFWRCVLVHYHAVGWNWPQTSSVHRVWYSVAKSCDSISSSSSHSVQICYFTTSNAPPDNHAASTVLDGALFLHLFICSASWTGTHLPTTPFSSLPVSNVCALFPISVISFYWPVWHMAFSCQFCHDPSILRSPLHC